MSLGSLNNPSRLSLLAMILAITACGGSSGTGNDPQGNPGPDGGPNSPDSMGACGVVYDVPTLAQSGYTLPSVVGDFVITTQSAFETCEQSITTNGTTTSTRYEGYAKVYANPKFVPQGSFRVEESRDRSTRTINLLVTNVPTLSSNDKADIAQKLGALPGHDINESIEFKPALRIGQSLWVVFSSGQIAQAVVVASDRNDLAFIKISIDFGAEGEIARQLNNGSLSIEMFYEVQPGFGQPVLVQSDLVSKQLTVTATLKNSSVTKLIKALWADSWNNRDRASVLAQFDSLSARYKISNPKSELSNIYEVCDKEWSPVPNSLTDLSWSTATLRFLNTVDSEHPTKRLWSTYKSVANHSFGSNRSALGESLWLVYKSGLSESEQEALVQVYGLVEQSGLPYSDKWNEAKEFARSGGYQVASVKSLIARIRSVYEWAGSYSGPNLGQTAALTKATNYVRDRNFSGSQFSMTKAVFEWMLSYSGPNVSSKTDALAQTEDLVFDSTFSQDQFSILKSTFEWIVSYSGPNMTNKSDAYANTKNLVLIKKMTKDQFTELKRTFEWVQSYSGPNITNKADALSKTEDLVVNRRMSNTQYSTLKRAFEWMISYSGPNLTNKADALPKVIGYVFDKNMTSEKFDSLKRAFDKHSRSNSNKAEALAKAEADVFNN